MNISVFVSGRGSNLRAIHAAVQRGELDARLRLVISNRSDSPALDFGRTIGAQTTSLADTAPGSEEETARILDVLRQVETEFIVLAGYMRMIPEKVVKQYHQRIVNIHPALLPSFGGKGMYGHKVHEAVLAAGVKVSGATVHLVNEEYDRGPIVMQQCVPVLDSDTPETLAARVLEVEHALYSRALQLLISGRIRITENRTFIQ
ncbi:MAG: phosphoribosylglycinamide formyltransferase [Bacteroidia bacterium]|nr:phosphoribosylglycinamide formyltransferase [Bacteroidia bacterium]